MHINAFANQCLQHTHRNARKFEIIPNDYNSLPIHYVEHVWIYEQDVPKVITSAPETCQIAWVSPILLTFTFNRSVEFWEGVMS